MSTLAYAAITGKREQAAPSTSKSGSPGLGTYVDMLSALVPAEVLTAHAAILPFTTNTIADAAGKTTVTITQPGTLIGAFYALILLSMIIYVVAHYNGGKWDRWDCLRMLIPACAFVGWTMLQKATAFDAVAPHFNQAARGAIAIIGAIMLGLLATALAYKADATTP